MGTLLLTGANSSLAIPAVHYLLSQYPNCTAILTVRDISEKDPNTTKLRTTIAGFPNAKYKIRQLDLASLSAVQAFAEETQNAIARRRIPPLAAIICNAFTWNLSGIQYSEDGYEKSIAVNHIGHLSLVLRLLDAMDGTTGRIVFLSSDTHEPGKAGFETYPPIFPEDLRLLVHPEPDASGQEVGRGFQRYGLSKLAVIMSMYALQRRLKSGEQHLSEIKVIAMDPGGLLDSRAFRGDHVPALWKMAIAIMNWLQPVLRFAKPTLRRTSEAARDLVDLAIGQQFGGKEGHFIMTKKMDSSPASQDREMQEVLWRMSLEWCKITKTDTILSLQEGWPMNLHPGD